MIPEQSVSVYLWTSATEKSEISANSEPIFGDGRYFEPGYIAVKFISVKNNGDTAKRYKIILEATQPDDEAHKAHSLTDVLSYKFISDARFGNTVDRSINGTRFSIGENAIRVIEILAGEEAFFAIAIHMDEAAGNEYQSKSISLGVKAIETTDAPTVDEPVTPDEPAAGATTVDKSGWDAAYAALENCEIKTVQDVYALMGDEWMLGQENYRVEDYVIVENGYLRSSEWSDVIYINIDGVCYCYGIYHTDAEPFWRQSKTEFVPITIGGPIVALYQTQDKFDLFEYDEETGLYVASNLIYIDELENTEVLLESVSIGFTDGKITAFSYSTIATVDAGSITYTMKQVVKFTFDCYGTAEIELPTEYVTILS